MRELKVDAVTKRFGKTVALDNVSFSLEHGKLHALLGRNGAGKSTLLGIASNRLLPTSGQVLVDGERVTDNPSALAKMFCMSDLRMYPESMYVDDMLKQMAHFHEGFDPHAADRFAQAFGLNVKAKIGSLSTGYRSICQLVAALATDVSYLLLDEPVLGLDANHRELFYKLLLEDYLEKQRTIVVATHLIEEISNLVEHVVVIDRGRVLIESSADDLRSSGYSVSGRTVDVEAYCQGLEALGVEAVGSLSVAYFVGKPDATQLNERLDIAPISMQKLFVKLTDKEG